MYSEITSYLILEYRGGSNTEQVWYSDGPLCHMTLFLSEYWTSFKILLSKHRTLNSPFSKSFQIFGIRYLGHNQNNRIVKFCSAEELAGFGIQEL